MSLLIWAILALFRFGARQGWRRCTPLQARLFTFRWWNGNGHVIVWGIWPFVVFGCRWNASAKCGHIVLVIVCAQHFTSDPVVIGAYDRAPTTKWQMCALQWSYPHTVCVCVVVARNHMNQWTVNKHRFNCMAHCIANQLWFWCAAVAALQTYSNIFPFAFNHFRVRLLITSTAIPYLIFSVKSESMITTSFVLLILMFAAKVQINDKITPVIDDIFGHCDDVQYYLRWNRNCIIF